MIQIIHDHEHAAELCSMENTRKHTSSISSGRIFKHLVATWKNLFMKPGRLAALVLFKSYAQLRAEASRYFLSVLWWVLDPILSMLVFYVIFGLVLMRGGPDFVDFLLIGIVAWQWFERGALHGMTSIYSNGHLMNLIQIPKLYFPAVTTLVDTFKFLIVFVLLVVFLWFRGYVPTAAYLGLPVVMIVELLFIAGIAFLLAGLMPILPDLKYLAELILRLGFFASGVFLPASRVPDDYRVFLELNPMVTLIESYRAILMQGQWPDWEGLGYVAFFSLFLLGTAMAMIRRFDYDYPRLLSR